MLEKYKILLLSPISQNIEVNTYDRPSRPKLRSQIKCVPKCVDALKGATYSICQCRNRKPNRNTLIL